MALTQQDLDQVYQYVLSKGMSIQGLTDGGTDLSRMYLAPVLEYNQAGTAANLVRLAVSLLKGDSGKSAYEEWKEQEGNSGKTLAEFFVSLKGAKGDPFTYSDFTPEQLDNLQMTFDKMTSEEIAGFWAAIPADVLAQFQKPATAAAAEVREEMTRISQEASQVITDTNTAKTNAETATTNANTAATAANAAAGLATDAADDANTAAGIAVEAATLAGSKAEQVSTAARNAITATEDAINATSGAVAATGLANAAATAANTAKDNADIATGNANIATDRANAAAQAAENIVLGIRPDYNVSDPTSGNYIANKPEIPTLAVVPGSDTLSYVNSSGTTINFRIGDEVRVLENGEYVFYKLYDLADGVASWQESGSGTALPGNIYLQGANYYNESVRIIKGGNLNE
ncbi:hypothetical protein [Parabacteroides provencensis]|uniref:hypothetical protein n=1 Tax=Parabacteroides provencensis TaxID=1944636 RepID=UPI00117F0F16|nr:hypothetical protein [Parabacteroides provencensis]